MLPEANNAEKRAKQSVKYVVAILTFFFVLFICNFPVFSHPGKTDSSGGHYNRSTGEYHYHHGYPAHAHENGICPYEFDDNTDHTTKDVSSSGITSGTSSASNENGKKYTFTSSQTTSSIEKQESSLKQSKKTESKSGFWFDIIFDLISFTILVILPSVVGIANLLKKRKYFRGKKQYAFPFMRIYSNLIPNGYTIEFTRYNIYPKPLGIPISKTPYAVFFSEKSTCYHRQECSSLTNVRSGIKCANIYILQHHGKYHPCQRCNPCVSDENWVRKIRSILSQDCALYRRVKNEIILNTKKKHFWSRKKYIDYRSCSQAQALIHEAATPEMLASRFSALGCTCWPCSVHSTQEQIERYRKATTEPLIVQDVETDSDYYEVIGTRGDKYKVSLTFCSCGDFKFNTHQKAPCKHIYYLARYLTILKFENAKNIR